jgi:16S rRNA A1518/A1519 N6-dimethyltransferase RsmA/KsgA/DIM1 with predicted DNA glycosylase/AP lyase activity
MVQREVADRILEPAGSKTYGALAVGCSRVADVSRVMNVSRDAFRPVPDVMSSVVRIVPHDPPRLTPDDEAALRELTRAAFQQRRKQFQRILRDAYDLSVDEVAARRPRRRDGPGAAPRDLLPPEVHRPRPRAARPHGGPFGGLTPAPSA